MEGQRSCGEGGEGGQGGEGEREGEGEGEGEGGKVGVLRAWHVLFSATLQKGDAVCFFQESWVRGAADFGWIGGGHRGPWELFSGDGGPWRV